MDAPLKLFSLSLRHILHNFADSNFEGLSDLIYSIVRVLLTKNIPFSVYRFPQEQNVNLALEKGLVSFEGKTTFWISPFVLSKSVKEVSFETIPENFINEDLLASVKALPGEKNEMENLPEEMSKKDYILYLGKYLEEINKGHIRKAVLSRPVLKAKPQSFSPVETFRRLCHQHENAFVHLSFFSESGLWMGASPELLLLKKGKQYHTMALAGTRSSEQLKEEGWRTKEKEEHAMVCEHIESVFSKSGLKLVSKEGPETVKAGKVLHLKTGYVFEEKSLTDLRALLNKLNPTPAIGGLPVKDGLQCISENEGYDRRYYSGFIGETDFKNYARLFVNLRCMQIGKENVAIYCGGGITVDSNPEEEWEETVQKCKTMQDSMVDLQKNEIVR